MWGRPGQGGPLADDLGTSGGPRIARDALAAGIPVVMRLDDLPAAPDLIHGQHHLETIAALRQFPGRCRPFSCVPAATSGTMRRHDIPESDATWPLTSFAANACLASMDRAAPRHHGLNPWTWLDGRGVRCPSARGGPCSVSNYAGADTHLEPVTEACRRMGLDLVVVGSGVGHASAAPEEVLPDFDLVFAKARCAIEAMASGCAVILCDTTGLGELVTTTNVQRLRPWNFGFRVFERPLDSALIGGEIQRYNAADAARVSRYMREHAKLDGGAERRHLPIGPARRAGGRRRVGYRIQLRSGCTSKIRLR